MTTLQALFNKAQKSKYYAINYEMFGSIHAFDLSHRYYCDYIDMIMEIEEEKI